MDNGMCIEKSDDILHDIKTYRIWRQTYAYIL